MGSSNSFRIEPDEQDELEAQENPNAGLSKDEMRAKVRQRIEALQEKKRLRENLTDVFKDDDYYDGLLDD